MDVWITSTGTSVHARGGAVSEIGLRARPSGSVMDGDEYQAYLDGDEYEYFGAFYDVTPVVLEAPSPYRAPRSAGPGGPVPGRGAIGRRSPNRA